MTPDDLQLPSGDLQPPPDAAHFDPFAPDAPEHLVLPSEESRGDVVAPSSIADAPLFDENGRPITPRVYLPSRPLPDFVLPAPSDPSILIGNRWLSRGDLAILASTSGMGKSSLSLQAAVTWALGRRLFDGFHPTRPLRSLVLQSEDGDGDIAEVWLSLKQAMNLTEEEIARARASVHIVTDRVHRGLAFRAEIAHHAGIHRPDLVWINPLLAFLPGDVNDASDVGEFIRSQLNSLNEPARFAYIVVHHTAKPPKEKKERQWNEVMYEMAGSAELTNAARAILALQATEVEGQFRLIAAKRGIRAGLTRLVPGAHNPDIRFEQPSSVIHVRHSKERLKATSADGTVQDIPLIHWERFEPEAPPPASRVGRPREFTFAHVARHFPSQTEDPHTFRTIFKFANEEGVRETTLREIIREAVQDGLVECTKSAAGYMYRLK